MNAMLLDPVLMDRAARMEKLPVRIVGWRIHADQLPTLPFDGVFMLFGKPVEYVQDIPRGVVQAVIE